MANSQHKGPKGSECPIREWLEQIGATDICYVGNQNEPPDFAITYSGERIAVEVARLLPAVGWGKETETAFGKELGKLIEEAASDPGSPRWESWCEYDSRDRCPSRSKAEAEAWKKRAREALLTRGPGGEFQLLSPKQLVGRGIVLGLRPARNQGSFSGVSVDEGYLIESMLVDQLICWTGKKSSKVKTNNLINKYCRWWLAFDDEIVIAPPGMLGRSRQKIESDVRGRIDTELWSKVVLVSRFQLEQPPPKKPKWFWPLWENPQCAALPDSPC
ncbi:MAG: hypothetical protein OXC26_22480 [Albidovulum sp.]|nr:hypothetical protein [Albidovulum sp.]